ncbi:hypothetical protein ACMDCR_06075 [Labrys okinawensis]|uniref:hypothetical protein n=1 Tax=Labrys okinawensis TaxID=346911 RepID=UPI0039BCEE08
MRNKYDPDQLVTYNRGSRHMTLRQAIARYKHERSQLSPTDHVELHTDGRGEDNIITEEELQKLIDHPDFFDPKDTAG